MADESKVEPSHIEATRPHEDEHNDWIHLQDEAREATDEEHQMGFRTAMARYPKAVFWSVVVSLVVIMDGYDTALIGSLFGFPAFQRRFGADIGTTGNYQVAAKWQEALGLASPLGNIVGIFLNGLVTERFGHKRALLGSLTWLTACIFIVFFAPNVQVLFVGELLCGLAWGVFTTMAPAYASEVTPVVLRGHLEIWVVMCWGIGQLVAWGILDGLDTNLTNWAWRIPFAVQWVWPAIIFPLIIFCPESPWWLVRRGRTQDAERAVQRLSSASIAGSAHKTVALMVETTRLEQTITEGARYYDCLRGSNRWRTEISCMAWLTQAVSGFAIASYAVYFFEQAGLQATQAYKLTVGQGGLALVCNIISFWMTRRFGRRPIFLWGCAWMSTMMFIIGFLALAKQNIAISYASAALYMAWFAGFQLSIGPVAFIIVGETSSTRLRSKTIALARNAYNVWNIMSASVAPYILNPTEGNWKGKSGFLAGGLTLLCILWAFFRLPECKDRTYEELDLLFANGVSARQFKGYQLDVQAEVNAKGLAEKE